MKIIIKVGWINLTAAKNNSEKEQTKIFLSIAAVYFFPVAIPKPRG